MIVDELLRWVYLLSATGTAAVVLALAAAGTGAAAALRSYRRRGGAPSPSGAPIVVSARRLAA